ncbi:MAG: VCBS repeat-containing protein [Opitutae bacterium]|nr:VCBS repeat-containing protein [Opitutae bacterium]MBT5379706.1 VCBS repeat-containing protein [Opitutae bacterium]MBT5689891.1 VCBS repeat-containing protein [Opitutae bacterium]MBT6463053.1 VCBS repeat-containing protein [Opitutae bacterium]MBT6958212.1 VCBS repeat-containing protein [Opitutae bacterium]
MKSTLLIIMTFSLVGPPVQSAPQFRKTVVDTLFRSEGVGYGDVNKDGSNDILVGDFWYQAPDWKAHEIRKPRKPNRGGYTEAFAVYPDDFNRDGWVDVMVIPFHGKPAKWYENPKGAEGHWKERIAFKGTGNETRLYTDLFEDGQKVFLMGVEEHIAWVGVPDAKSVNEEWKVNNVSDRFPNSIFPRGWPAHKFAHGLGAADVNGDGRKDILTYGGWWEQPENGRKHDGIWTFHKSDIIKGGVADMYTLDADGDGLRDILCTSAHGTGIFWCRQVKANKFETTTMHKGLIHETHSANMVDLNGDGRLDLVTGRRFFAHGFRPEKAGDPSQLYWFDIQLKKGSPPELVPTLIDDQSGVGAQFVTEDFNGDKKTDILISNRKGVFLFTQK